MTGGRVFTLDERYLRRDGTIFLTGLQALVRMLLDRSRHDEGVGLRTAAYVSGYEGSPLAGYDLELARWRGLLREHRVTHQSGLNEELAATAVYAASYAEFVERVRAREADVTGDELLARTVAANLFKLAAYKDEYEVARLSLDPALTAAITEQFGSGARYAYRLHPPVLRILGMRSKISLGPAFRPAFRCLVAMRRLRGTRFDPFGRTQVRRVERALVAEYRDVITRLADDLTADNHALAVAIAGLPDMVRGYEHLKLENVRAYRERLAELLAEFRLADLGSHSR